MPPDGVHKKPCRVPVPELVREAPTIHPRLLMLRAELCPPPRVPRSLIPPVCVQEKACRFPFASRDCPTTVPAPSTASPQPPAHPNPSIPPPSSHLQPT